MLLFLLLFNTLTLYSQTFASMEMLPAEEGAV